MKPREEHKVTQAFGGALTAALDAMAFTHELDVNVVMQGVGDSSVPYESLDFQVKLFDLVAAGNFEVIVYFKETKNQPETRTSTGQSGFDDKNTFTSQRVEHLPTSNDTLDPLRDLVLQSKNSQQNDVLNELAVKAASLTTNSEEILVKSKISVKNVSGLLAGTDAFIKKIEETITKTCPTLNHSDSDGFRGTNLF